MKKFFVFFTLLVMFLCNNANAYDFNSPTNMLSITNPIGLTSPISPNNPNSFMSPLNPNGIYHQNDKDTSHNDGDINVSPEEKKFILSIFFGIIITILIMLGINKL